MPVRPPVFCAVADSAYFLGAVALINSLRLTGHEGEIAFLDVGLSESERSFLEREATVHPGPEGAGWLSVFVKPTLAKLYPDRTVALLDNDLVITGSLEPLLSAADAGNVAAFEQPDTTRWFGDWEQLFSLRAPLRRGRYANGGCVVLSSSRWAQLIERWLELGDLVGAARANRPFLLRAEEVSVDPMGYNEQDTLNALLMSEVPEYAVQLWPHELTPFWEERDQVRVVDKASLRCQVAGATPVFLHATGQPKPWQANGWLRLRFLAFNRLFARVLVADDVALRLPASALPPWLRPGLFGRILGDSAAVLARAVPAALALVPRGVRSRITTAGRARVSGTGPRSVGDPPS